jgi:capsular exopolysaccharide synthesis family protein
MKSDGVALRLLNSLSDAEFLKMTKFQKDETMLPGASSDALTARQSSILRTFENQTDVKQTEGTQLVSVGVKNSDPRMAARLANGLVLSYQSQSIASRDASVSQLRGSLTAQIQALRSQVDESQRKLAAFQEANSILGTQGQSNTVTDRLKALNDHLATADADRIAKEGQLRAADLADPAALTSLFADPKLNELQSQQGILYSKYAELAAKFGAKYPPLVEIKKQLDSIGSEISANANAIRARLRQEYVAADNVQKMFQREYDDQIAMAYSVNRNQAEYARLLAEVTSGREVADALQRKLNQAVIDAEVSGVNVMPIDVARPSTIAIGPSKSLIVLSGLLIGLVAGIAAAFIFEASSDKLSRGDQIENATGYPIFGVIPHSPPGIIALGDPLSDGSEAYRNVRNNLLLSSPDHPSRIILVASSTMSEDAESVACNTAISLAQAGIRTLLIDSDLRSPNLHKIFGVANEKGLSDALREGGTPSITKPLMELPELSLLTAGGGAALSSDELASDRLPLLLQQLKTEFDYVVISGAPLLSSSDSMLLAKRADAVLLVARHQVTRMGTLSRVRSLLAQVEARVAGAVLNNVPSKSEG